MVQLQLTQCADPPPWANQEKRMVGGHQQGPLRTRLSCSRVRLLIIVIPVIVLVISNVWLLLRSLRSTKAKSSTNNKLQVSLDPRPALSARFFHTSFRTAGVALKPRANGPRLGNRIVMLSTYPPTKCGIATYGDHMRSALLIALGRKGLQVDVDVIEILQPHDSRSPRFGNFSKPVVFQVRQRWAFDYIRAARFVGARGYSHVLILLYSTNLASLVVCVVAS